MYSTLIAMAVARIALTIALATITCYIGYRIGFCEALVDRSARIHKPRFDGESDDRTISIAGLLPAIGGTHNQEVSTMNPTVSNPHSRTFEGIIADLSVRNTLKGQTVAMFKLEGDPEGVTCVVFPRLFSACGDLLADGAPVRVSGELESSDDYTQLVCRQIDLLTQAR